MSAWAKLVYLSRFSPTEVGGFAITADGDHPFLVTDIVLPKQTCTVATVSFDDESVADFFEDQEDKGLEPFQCGRIWIHTHPGNCPTPSGTDETTFERVFSPCDWSIMLILSEGGQVYCRLHFGVGPGADIEIPVEVDFGYPFEGSDIGGWQDEFNERVTVESPYWQKDKKETKKERKARKKRELVLQRDFSPDPYDDEEEEGLPHWADADDEYLAYLAAITDELEDRKNLE